MKRRNLLARAAALSAAPLAAPAIVQAQATKISFYYPIAVGGPIPAIVDGYCKQFQQETS